MWHTTSKFRLLDAEKLAAAKKEFLALEKAGIVRRTNSLWASPLHMFPKQDGTWRPCGDYRCLNSVTVPDTYLIPNMLDFASHAAGCTHFSKIDLKKGYHQVPMNAADIPKRQSQCRSGCSSSPDDLWHKERGQHLSMPHRQDAQRHRAGVAVPG